MMWLQKCASMSVGKCKDQGYGRITENPNYVFIEEVTRGSLLTACQLKQVLYGTTPQQSHDA